MEQNINKQKGHPRRQVAKCLCCGQDFAAASPFLRVCPICKESEEWQSGNCDVALHSLAANDNDA